MAGLLDGFGDFLKSPEGQGLLSGVMGYAANARQGTPWNNLGRGGLAGLTGYAGALDRQAQAAEAEQMKKYRDAQLENFKRQQSAQDAAAARQAKTDSALANPYKMEGGSGGFSLQTDANGLPIFDTNMNFSPVVAPKKVLDVNNLLASHVSPKQIQEIAELDNLGKTEVARTIEVQRPDGVYTVSFDKYGNQKGEPQKKFTAPTEVGQGDRKTFVDFAAGGKPVLSVPINQSPDSKAANALGWANHNVSRERLNFDKAGGADANKPTYSAEAGGFIYKPDAKNPQGRLVPLAGLPDKPLTETQGNAALFASRALQAHKALTPLEQDGGGTPGTIKRAMTAITPGLGMNLDESMGTMLNWTQSKEQQTAEQAQRNFITAVLRKESGASISPGEFATASQIYFPQPGDSAEIIKQKQATRESAINGMKLQSGAAGSRYVEQSAQTIPPDAVKHLKMNPSLRADFDAKYGLGASDQYLR